MITIKQIQFMYQYSIVEPQINQTTKPQLTNKNFQFSIFNFQFFELLFVFYKNKTFLCRSF